MMHLAAKHGMNVVRDGPETDAYLALPQATPASVFTEWFQERQADSLHFLRQQAKITRSLIRLFALQPAAVRSPRG
jgi:hypothetical protein